MGLISAITVAGANTVIKAGSDILMGRAAMSLSAAIIVVPIAFFIAPPDAATWAALGLSVPAHLFYQFCLIRAMHRGDLSLVFPVMRGMAPVLTACLAFVVLGESLTWLSILGLLIASSAVSAFALMDLDISKRSLPNGAALFWAGATAIGIALCNVFDARGVRIAPSALTYIVWLFLFDWIGVIASATIVRRAQFIPALKVGWRYGFAGGALSVFSFGAMLFAYRIADAATIAALRETSVVFAALMGWLLLSEQMGKMRSVGALIVAIGLILMQIGVAVGA